MTFMKGLPLLLLIASLCSYAALQPDRTRIVFNANDKATSLRVDNRSDKLPYLAYSWLENEKGEKSDDLLVALPPIQRLEPKATTQVRIVKQASTAKLPGDRETLFSTICVKFLPPQKKTAAMPFCRSPSRVVSRCSGDRPRYARKQEKKSSYSYKSASRAINLT